jgi:dihydroorotase
MMSKFLNLDLSLDKVVRLATAAPVYAIGLVPSLGTLEVGAPADLSAVEIVEGSVDFVDTRQNERKGQSWIKPVQTVEAGRPFGRPCPLPFA